jgi:hypothetical protein
LDQSNHVTPESLKAATLPDLMAKREAAAEQMAFWKSIVGMIDVEISARGTPSLTAAYAAQNKLSGTLSVPTVDGITFVGDMDKTVKWDSGKLMGIANKLTWEQAQALFKIEFSVPEKIYTAMAATNPELKTAIDEARSVKYALKVAAVRKAA